MNFERDLLIYGLIDPRNNEIRYIGKSLYGLYRLKAHLAPSKLKIKSKKNSWIKSLLKLGLVPHIIVLDRAENEKELDQKEIEHIAKYTNLTNLTKGGTGGNTGGAHKK